MNHTLLRSSDYLYQHPKHVPNIYWSELLKTIDQFDQLLEIEKKQISNFLKEKQQKKISMIKRFYQFKDSMKFIGQSVKKDIIIIDKEKFQLFFDGYQKELSGIITMMIKDPKLLAQMLVCYGSYKKYKIIDFCQNIPLLIYPFYLPLLKGGEKSERNTQTQLGNKRNKPQLEKSQQKDSKISNDYHLHQHTTKQQQPQQQSKQLQPISTNKIPHPNPTPIPLPPKNNCLIFIEQIINLWPYSIEYARPKYHSIIDDVIYGFMKIPPIVCYIEKITTNFLKDINHCKMEIFTFDEDAIKNEIDLKQSSGNRSSKSQIMMVNSTATQIQTSSSNDKKSVSFGTKFKNLFSKKPTKYPQPQSQHLPQSQHQHPPNRSSMYDHPKNKLPPTNLSVSQQKIPDMSSSGFINNQHISSPYNSMRSQRSESEYSQIPEMMKNRQTNFIELIKNTVENILNEQLPWILKKILQLFHKKIKTEIFKQSIVKGTKNPPSKQVPNPNPQPYLKHYCYFLMTNLICAELHNKFTMSHQDSGMTNADLQNISEVIRILSSIFQGQQPDLKKYQNIICGLGDYREDVIKFYENIINFEGGDTEKIANEEESTTNIFNQQSQTEMKEILLNYYQNSVLVSFNDVRILVDLYEEMKKNKQKQKQKAELENGQTATTQKSTTENKSHSDPHLIINIQKLFQTVDSPSSKFNFNINTQFLNKPQVQSLFDPTKKIQFQNTAYLSENILFIQQWGHLNTNELIEYYVADQQPLQYLPLMKDIFFFGSNLTVQESLEVSQDLKLIKKMPLKDIKQYLIKTANKFGHLNIKDFQKVEKSFKASLKKCLHHSIQRKQHLLFYRSEILYHIQQQINLINYFINELKSQQFYQKISQSFLTNIKIKIYLNIENNLLRVNKDMKQLKGLAISNLMLANNDSLSNKSNNDDYILRNSFKCFEYVKDLFRCISKNPITKAALLNGRKVEEYNTMFCKAVQLSLNYIDQFLEKKHILQSLTREKLQTLIINRLQNSILMRYFTCTVVSTENKLILISDDKLLSNAITTQINKQKFYKAEISPLNIDTQFLLQQGKDKLEEMIKQFNVTNKITHLEELFKLIFTIVGFTMAKGKISSDIITPIMQFLILECPDIGHFRCLYAMQCLKYNQKPEIVFQITNYRSALMYIKENMAIDFPSNVETEMQSELISSSSKNYEDEHFEQVKLEKRRSQA